MKRVWLILLAVIMAHAVMPAFCIAEASLSTDVSVSISDTFQLEFFTPDGAHVMFSTSVPFSNIDPTETFALADGRTVNDNKSDVGVYCKSSQSSTWYLKIGMTGAIPTGNLKYYLSQPTMYVKAIDQSIETNGAINPDPAAWSDIPNGSTKTIYASGTNDTVNTPFGTLATLNFQLIPGGLASGSYAASVTYTATTTA